MSSSTTKGNQVEMTSTVQSTSRDIFVTNSVHVAPSSIGPDISQLDITKKEDNSELIRYMTNK